MKHVEAPVHEVGDLPQPGKLNDGTAQAPAILATVASHLAQAVGGLKELAQILANDLPSLHDPEQSHAIDAPPITARRTTMDSSSTSRTARNYYTLAEVATMLNLDARSLRRLRRDSTAKFPAARKFGRALRWKAAEIDAWAERQRSRL